MLSHLQFTLPEILSLLGLTQCVYVLVYMLLRSGNLINAVTPSLYFLFMGLAFLTDIASSKWNQSALDLDMYQWFFWFCGIPIGSLLILQIAQIREKPRAKYFLLLLIIPVTFLPGFLLESLDVLYLTGLMTGALSLLAIWLRRDLLDGLYANPKFGRERFWLIMALIGLGTAFLASTLGYINQQIDSNEWVLVRTFLGIAFVYIAGTSLFRIYPQSLKKENFEDGVLSASDHQLLQKLQGLFEQEKVYQDPSFGRAELSREVGTGEATLSRIINHCYGKTIPQLLNEFRVKDAQKLLKDTDVAIQSVFEESGFNSVTTFNRVFKEISGETPKEYRARHRS